MTPRKRIPTRSPVPPPSCPSPLRTVTRLLCSPPPSLPPQVLSLSPESITVADIVGRLEDALAQMAPKPAAAAP